MDRARFTLGGRGEPRYDRIVPDESARVERPATPELGGVRVAALFPQDPVGRYEAPMLGWSLGFYACYFAAVAGLVPMVVSGALGVLCLLRYFNRFHEALHADTRGQARWHPARVLLVLMGPLYLGYRELRDQHLAHHREDGGPRDPDLWMLADSPVRSVAACLLQPELSVIDHVRRAGLTPRIAAGLAARAAAYAGLMWIGGWPGFILYNVMTRVGNGVAWFVFSWVVHGPWLYGQVRPPRFPGPLAAAWVVLVGRENLHGIRFHYLHHCFPHVPDRDLPALSRRLHRPGSAQAGVEHAAGPAPGGAVATP